MKKAGQNTVYLEWAQLYSKIYISKGEKLEVVISEWWGYCFFVNLFLSLTLFFFPQMSMQSFYIGKKIPMIKNIKLIENSAL